MRFFESALEEFLIILLVFCIVLGKQVFGRPKPSPDSEHLTDGPPIDSLAYIDVLGHLLYTQPGLP